MNKWENRFTWILVLLFSPLLLPIIFIIIWLDEGLSGAVRTFRGNMSFQRILKNIWLGEK